MEALACSCNFETPYSLSLYDPFIGRCILIFAFFITCLLTSIWLKRTSEYEYLFQFVCSQGEEDETAIDVNFSGSLDIEKTMLHYIPNYHSLMPLKLGVLHGETKISGSLSKP
jgi:hypothetical protein